MSSVLSRVRRALFTPSAAVLVAGAVAVGGVAVASDDGGEAGEAAHPLNHHSRAAVAEKLAAPGSAAGESSEAGPVDLGPVELAHAGHYCGHGTHWWDGWLSHDRWKKDLTDLYRNHVHKVSEYRSFENPSIRTVYRRCPHH